VKYRISTITGSPGRRTVRRRTCNGFAFNGEPGEGVFHPSTQVADGSPLVGGGDSGSAGGVGLASVGVEGNGEGDGEDGGVGNPSPGPPSQAARSRSAATIMRFFVR
jgi:hypothetical protein